MNEITKTNKDKAYELNSRILACANAAYSSLMESAKLLKEMRDTKLYLEMGYESFEEKLQGLGAMIELVDSEREMQKFKLRVG